MFTLKPGEKHQIFIRTHPVSSQQNRGRQIDSLSRVDDKIGNSSTICDSLFQRISEMKNDMS